MNGASSGSSPRRACEVGVELARLEEEPRAEAAHVAVGDVGAVVQPDERAAVRVVVEAVRAVPQAPGHPEVDQQDAVGLEADDQVLAAALDRGDALALELGGDLVRLVRPHETRVADLDAVEPPAREDGLQAAANGLDLGQLGHRSRLDSAARDRPLSDPGAWPGPGTGVSGRALSGTDGPVPGTVTKASRICTLTRV